MKFFELSSKNLKDTHLWNIAAKQPNGRQGERVNPYRVFNIAVNVKAGDDKSYSQM